MKNKRIYKFWLQSSIDLMLAMFLSYITFLIAKEIVVLDYNSNGYNSLIWRIWINLRARFIGDNTVVILGIITFLIYYFIITYKKTKSLIAIMDETEIMANGDLDRTIKVEASGDIKRLVENINNISTQLKEITIDERKAQQTKTDLITNVSHDLRTPLTSIIGYLEIIDRDQYKDEVELRYYTNIAYEKAKSLNLLINDLFELTKLQNNAIKLEKKQIDLVELLGQVVAYFEYQFRSADMKSRTYFSEDKLIVNADGEKLVRAFENLLSNSIKYGKDGFYVDVTSKIEGEQAVVQIINYGRPISPIDLPHVFDRFYRVEKSRNSKIGWSGLGLAITKNIIELHKGVISASSDNEKTIFEIKLPVDKKYDNID